MVKGLDKLVAQLNSIKKLDKGKALLAGAFTLQKYSMKNAPVLTGFLRSSHYSRQVGEQAEMVVGANYAFYQEFGTSRIPARAFVRRAKDENMGEIVGAVKTQLEKDIKGKL